MEKIKTLSLLAYTKAQYFILIYLNAIERLAKLIVVNIFRVDLVNEHLITTTVYILLNIIILSLFCYLLF